MKLTYTARKRRMKMLKKMFAERMALSEGDHKFIGHLTKTGGSIVSRHDAKSGRGTVQFQKAGAKFKPGAGWIAKGER